MRIISGQFKGRRLKAESRGKTRPTSARVRAAVFDILGPRLSGVRVLDLFAGTGAFGIEALSRGALAAVFVEAGREPARVLKRNLELLGLMDKARVFNKKAIPALKLLAAEEEKFGLIFMDPPYGRGEEDRTMEVISRLELFEPPGVVICEHGKDHAPAERYGGLLLVDRRVYGGSAVSFYEMEDKK